MTKEKKDLSHINELLALLDEHYGTEITCYLDHGNAWQLLFATILSAQCTDVQVNAVTEKLYVKYRSIEDFAGAKLEELERDVHSTGFYHNKAKNIIACAQKLLSDFGGEVPEEMEKLLTLPGVGRKTANVIRGNIFGTASIVVDTHVKRITKRLGLTEADDPEKVEYDLMECLPEDHWILYNLQIIAHGRKICMSRNPRCGECFLKELCPSCRLV